MYYQINDKVGFNPVNCTLWAIEEPEASIPIPRLASLLLELLAKNNKKSLPREFFMNELWESKGLVASSNNLNNYISIIRRTLSGFGVEDIIKTIPKYGFSFNATKIECFDIKNQKPILNEKNNENSILNQVVNENKFILKKGLIIISIITIIILIIYWLKSDDDKFLKIVSLGYFESCKVMSVWNGKPNNYDFNKIKLSLMNLSANNGIDCKMKSTVYYYESVTARTPNFIEKRVVLAQCPEIFGNNMQCVNYLMYETKYE